MKADTVGMRPKELKQHGGYTNRSRCAIRGVDDRGRACGLICVGGIFCGHKGECPHKVTTDGGEGA